MLDHKIADKTGFSRSWVSLQTTEYWKQKMITKDEKK